jgi:phosphoribosylformylglycinamidine cyclo-ligase
MNTDDVLCVGAVNDFILSNTIGRNASLINGDMIKAIITGYKEYSQKMADFGVKINLCGGETADLGDIVRLVVVDSTLMTRIKKSDFIMRIM